MLLLEAVQYYSIPNPYFLIIGTGISIVPQLWVQNLSISQTHSDLISLILQSQFSHVQSWFLILYFHNHCCILESLLYYWDWLLIFYLRVELEEKKRSLVFLFDCAVIKHLLSHIFHIFCILCTFGILGFFFTLCVSCSFYACCTFCAFISHAFLVFCIFGVFWSLHILSLQVICCSHAFHLFKLAVTLTYSTSSGQLLFLRISLLQFSCCFCALVFFNLAVAFTYFFGTESFQIRCCSCALF